MAHTLKIMMKPIRLFLLFAFLLPVVAKAQLTVTITASDSTLCVPATTCFTSTVTGGTAPYTYSWNFGFPNGTASIANPCATYTSGGNFTVSLKVIDVNGLTNTVTVPNMITAGTRPIVKFTNNGQLITCAPKTVIFTSTTTLNSSGAAIYTWDFGDGTGTVVNTPSVTHTYTYADTFDVTLQVQNGAGCLSDTTIPHAVIVAPSPIANFFSLDNIACKAPATVHFVSSSNDTNSSTTYKWYFGDGGNSAQKNPAHTYLAPGGIFTDTLIVTNVGGCTDTSIKTSYVKVGNLQPAFTIASTPTCMDEPVTFTNTSVTQADTVTGEQWYVDNVLVGSGSPFIYQFPTAGTHTVKMITQTATCTDSTSHPVVVNPKPVIDFTANSTYNCTAPFTVTFTATVANGVNPSYKWHFGDNQPDVTTATNTVTHTYSSVNSFSVTLTVTNGNATACTDSLTKTGYIVVAPATGTITAIPDQGCSPLPVGLTVTSSAGSGTVTSSNWSFDGINTGSNPTGGTISHTYTTTGVTTFTTTVTYVTSTGCTGTATKIIKTGIHSVPHLSISDLNPCATSELVTLDASASTNVFSPVTTYTFYPNGIPGPASTSTANVYHTTYNAIASYYPAVIVSNNGCKDTATSPVQVVVKGPAANYSYALNNCTNRLQVTFTNTSVSPAANGTTTYTWYFGDGTQQTTTTLTPAITHTYPSFGTWNDSLVAHNAITGCTSSKVIPVVLYPLSVATAGFTVSPNPVCVGNPVTATYNGALQGGFTYYYTFGNLPDTVTLSGPTAAQTYTFPAPGSYAVKLKIVDGNGCADSSTTSAANFVVVNGPTISGFTVSDSLACVGQPLTFTAMESTNNGHAITTRLWSFGTNPATTAATNPATHTYTLPGNYSVTYTITDNSPTTPAGGCSVSLTKPGYINVLGIPTPTFYFNDTVVCPHSPVQFINTTNDPSLTYLWHFNDGGTTDTSTAVNPVYSFNNGGIHHITLTATNANGCAGTYTSPDSIHVLEIQALFTMDDSTGACQPLTVCFTNQSISATSYKWIFGDGGTASIQNPCHTYLANDTFNVILVAKNAQGCSDTSSIHHVRIAGPKGTLTTSTDSTCAGSPITFTITNTNATSFLFDFRDGNTQTTTGTTTSVTYPYMSCGDYLPVVTLSDGTSCHFIIQDTIPVVIDRPNAGFYFVPDSACQFAKVQFTDTSTGCKHPVTAWLWDFNDGTGSTSTVENPLYAFNTSGIHHVRLIAKTAAGCADTVTHDVYIRLNPSITVTATSPGFCAYGKDTIIVHGAGTGLGYGWSTGNTGMINDSEVVITSTTTMPIVIHGTDAHGCMDTASITVAVYAVPVVTVTGDSVLCDGDSTQLFATVAPLTATYSWHLQLYGFRPSDSSSQNPHLGPHVTTQYPVIATTAQGCRDTAVKTVTVTQKPILTVSVPNPICAGDSEQLTGGGLSPSGTYSWTPPGGNTGPTITVKPTHTTTYTLNGTDGCNADPKTVTVIVNPLPLINAGPDITLCVGQDTVFHPTGGIDYTWLPSNDGTLSCSNCTSPTVHTQITETYTVIGVDTNGCLNSDKITVNIIQHVPTAVDSSDIHICQGESTTLAASGGLSYIWTPTTGLDNPNSAVTVAHPDTTTIYQVIVNENVCFTDTFDVTVNVSPKPTVNLGPDIHLNAGSFVQLHPVVTNATSFLWTPEDGLSCTDCLEPIASPLNSITYVLVASNEAGCRDSDNINITVVCNDGLIWFPNTFTPNGDGQNDLFYPRCEGTLLIRAFRVYNRWGEVVFERTNIRVNDLSNAWDGTYKGDPAEA